MLAQIGTALQFKAWFTKSKLGATGLTVSVDVYRDGTSIVTGASATAIGGGIYGYTLASGSNTAAGDYVAIFKTSDTTVDMQHVPSMLIVGQGWVERIDATVSGVAAAVWSVGTRTLTGFGSLVSDIWGNATRSLTDKAGFSLSVTPPTAAQNATAVRGELETELARIDAAVSSRSSHSAADAAAAVWAAGSRTLTGFGSLVADIASAAATAVWGAATRTLTAFGFSTGLPSAADNATAVWSAAERELTALPNPAPDGYGGGSGAGNSPYEIIIPVVDQGGEPVAGANVMLHSNDSAPNDETDVDGIVSLFPPLGTYRLVITKPGYSFTPIEVEVTASETLDEQAITRFVAAPSADPELVPVVFRLSDFGVAVDAKFTLEMAEPRAVVFDGDGEPIQADKKIVVNTADGDDGVVVGYVYPSSKLTDAGYKGGYIVNSPSIRNLGITITVPDEGGEVGEMIREAQGVNATLDD